MGKISETEEVTSTETCLHAFHINPYLHGYFEAIYFDSKFSLPWTIIVHGLKGKLGQI